MAAKIVCIYYIKNPTHTLLFMIIIRTHIKASLASLQVQTTDIFNVKNFVLHCISHKIL